MKRNHSENQPENFEHVRHIKVEPDSQAAEVITVLKQLKKIPATKQVYPSMQKDKTEIIPIDEPRNEYKVRERTPEEQYTVDVSRNVEIMGDLIWRYGREDDLVEQMKSQHTNWLTVMDRMKNVMQLCDIDNPLGYHEVFRIDPIKQKIIQRELETIYGRYHLEAWAKGFKILENWFKFGGDHK